jgi:hypothetical protein
MRVGIAPDALPQKKAPQCGAFFMMVPRVLHLAFVTCMANTP